MISQSESASPFCVQQTRCNFPQRRPFERLVRSTYTSVYHHVLGSRGYAWWPHPLRKITRPSLKSSEINLLIVPASLEIVDLAGMKCRVKAG